MTDPREGVRGEGRTGGGEKGGGGRGGGGGVGGGCWLTRLVLHTENNFYANKLTLDGLNWLATWHRAFPA